MWQTVPATLRAEHGELSGYVHVDLDDGTDIGGYVARARRDVEAAVGPQLQATAGERLEWTGQYKLLTAGQQRLRIIVPLVALMMLGLLFWQFGSLTESLIVLVSVPFALVGSFWTLYLLDYRLSAPVWVGLLSVVGLGIAATVLLTGLINAGLYMAHMGEALHALPCLPSPSLAPCDGYHGLEALPGREGHPQRKG